MRTRLKFREIIDENQMSVPLEKLLRGRSTIEILLENNKKGSVDRPTTAIQKESTNRPCSVFYRVREPLAQYAPWPTQKAMPWPRLISKANMPLGSLGFLWLFVPHSALWRTRLSVAHPALWLTWLFVPHSALWRTRLCGSLGFLWRTRLCGSLGFLWLSFWLCLSVGSF